MCVCERERTRDCERARVLYVFCGFTGARGDEARHSKIAASNLSFSGRCNISLH